jgi:hypothetical protein
MASVDSPIFLHGGSFHGRNIMVLMSISTIYVMVLMVNGAPHTLGCGSTISSPAGSREGPLPLSGAA